jgi:hypothetical protein
VGPPPSSWGQVPVQRLSAFMPEALQQAYSRNVSAPSLSTPSLDIARAPSLPAPSISAALEALVPARSSAPPRQIMPTPPPRSRCSWVSEKDVSWFAQSPCFQFSPAEQEARLRAAVSCVENPPAQEACYDAFLSRLPPSVSTVKHSKIRDTFPLMMHSCPL